MVDGKGSKRPPRTQAERARATRMRMLATARAMFARDGYSATTMARIAEEAGYAVQTVYLVFRTKGRLLTEVYEAAVLGDDENPTPPDDWPWVRTASTTKDGIEAVRVFTEGCAEILRRTGPLEPVMRSAEQAEPGVKRSHDYGEGLRAVAYRRFVESLSERGLLGEAADVGESTDVLLTLLGPSTYATFTRDHGWTHRRYVDWAIRTLSVLLLTSGADAARPAG